MTEQAKDGGKGEAGCSMGVGCDEAGVCYAMAHGQPERCAAPREAQPELVTYQRPDGSMGVYLAAHTPDPCKPGGCSTIGCEGGRYCFPRVENIPTPQAECDKGAA